MEFRRFPCVHQNGICDGELSKAIGLDKSDPLSFISSKYWRRRSKSRISCVLFCMSSYCQLLKTELTRRRHIRNQMDTDPVSIDG